MGEPLILVVEDDANLAGLLVSELRIEGYAVEAAADGISGLQMARSLKPDLILLDWMLPGLSGLDLCLRLRHTGIRTPVIMLTARDEITHRVEGLNAGADDYLIKPFSLEELLARVKVQLRKRQDAAPSELVFEDLRLNVLARQVHRGKRRIELTAKEFDLLEHFCRHPQQVLSRDQILKAVWGYDFLGESNIIEVYVRALRLKLEDDGAERLIQTVRGVGYVLRGPI
ncbi:response regulator transcription factor [Synechococcus sp. CBW1004]|jgi:DNA-binding response OmpR family regulator|uniref:response regulator transcription factor n=1 Tax=Synechococcus sp. CBW1004 TaxID=1353136 RepID=UPI0018CDA951|nr:response regulator transcription factor [Synechococcus sp. CBW1004]QPN64116.1 response regulator transcription factor [Synechococcus sp. CBW1004]